MNNTLQIRGFVRRVQILSLISGGMVGTVLLILESRAAGLGLFSGVIISVINFELMATDAFTIVEKMPGKARKFILGRYVMRYGIMFGFLALVATKTNLNVLAAFIGLFFVQLHLFLAEIIKAKKSGKIIKGKK